MSGMVTHGADVEALDDIAVALRRQGAKVADVGGRGAAHLEKLRALWDGPDFEKFAKEWRAAHRSIDDAELALRDYSRKLVAEADGQRASSQYVSGELDGGQGSGPAMERVEHGMAFAPVEDRPAMERVEHGMAFAPVEDGPAMERVEHGMAFERVDEGASGPPVRVEPLPGGLTGLALDGTNGSMLLQSPHGMLITDNLMAVLPDLPGGEELELGQTEPAAFERMDPTGGPDTGAGAAFERMDSAGGSDAGSGQAFERVDGAEPTPPAAAEGPVALQEAPIQEAPAQETPAAPAQEAPAQVPAEDGAHITTADDAAGQRSVAFDPRGVVDQTDWVDSSALSGWLGLDDLVLLPWDQG